MCGISGYSGSPIAGRLQAMNDALRHRGPDGEGYYQDPKQAMNLAHRRLAIIDVAAGQQPMANETGDLWLVFNGEIYNYLELRQNLHSHHHVQTHSDSEILLHLYEDHGSAMLQRLNGMFAFALWDEKRQTLFLARDRLGVKPLYWTWQQGRLIFGSELKALLCWPQISRAVDPVALSRYLSLRYVPEPLTIYRQIQTLPPAHYLTWSPGKEPVVTPYWQLDFTPRSEEEEESLADELEALLLDAVRLRLRSDVPVGACLSGGVDSSLVTAMIRKHHGGNLHTFSLGFAEAQQEKQDAHFAGWLARAWQTTHHEEVLTASQVLQDLPTILHHLDQPFSGVISAFFLAKTIKDHVKVALTGDGADDQFASYGHHRLVWPLERLAEARQQGVADPYVVADLAPLAHNPELVRRFDGMSHWQARAQYGGLSPTLKKGVLSPWGRQWLGEEGIVHFFQQHYQQNTAQDPLNRILCTDIHTMLPGEILFYADRLSMAHSVELRSPFLDYRVAQLAASVPGSLKIKGSTLKYLLKKVAARYLPTEILHRPKEGFVTPNHIWLKNSFRPLLQDLFSPTALAGHGLLDHEGVWRLINGHLSGREEHAFAIWTLVILQLWFTSTQGLVWGEGR
ncbi:MAG: asparagine synthase (glutamine-hydrolyzing) [Magnetococcales bacterium]|nr:asparagine synthase (glutamine-hydrolyzing) [Magnetococcales bacterium]NGZ28677.1 asparagine synthase (glutamine-hydrolyzing) [Magnetococcales bacterium]